MALQTSYACKFQETKATHQKLLCRNTWDTGSWGNDRCVSTLRMLLWAQLVIGLSCECYKFLRTVVLLPAEYTALLLYHYFHTLLKCNHQAGSWVLFCTQFGCDKKLNLDCCFAPHCKWVTLHRDWCSKTTALL